MNAREYKTRLELGRRIKLVRAALGDGINPLSQAEFCALLARVRHESYTVVKLSAWETGRQKLPLTAALDIATVDPKQRGLVWLVTGEPELDYSRHFTVPSSQPPATHLAVRKRAPRKRHSS